MRDKIKSIVLLAARRAWGGVEIPEFSVEIPELPEHGDYSTNIALILARTLKKPPLEIADAVVTELKTQSNKEHWFQTEIKTPGFINFYISPQQLAENIKTILKKKQKFGQGSKKKAKPRTVARSGSSARETVIIEYSSPNIAKPMGVHHLRTTIIGQALVNIYTFLGYRVLAMTFPGDWGTQFGSLIAAYKKWGNHKKMRKNPIQEMLNLYVRFSQMAEHDEGFQEEAKKEFKKLENGDKENKKIWRWFRKESFKDFDRVYKKLGVKIPYIFSESFFEPMLKAVIAEALNKKIAQKGEDGSVIIPLATEKTPLLLQKSDGATLYATRDLAQMKYRVKKWRPGKIVFVVANQQTFHFKQVFEAAHKLGYAPGVELAHVKFGMVLDSSGKKFATREGKLIPLETVIDEAVRRARKMIDDLDKLQQKAKPRTVARSAPSAGEKQKISRMVGIGALKFFDLAQNRMSDIIFDWDKMLNLKGASAPYLQYSYARLKNIIRKTGALRSDLDIKLLKEKEELALARHLMHFGETVAEAATHYEPNKIANYLIKLAEKINSLYETVPILPAEKKIRDSRLALISAAMIIIKSGCNLLGIEMPERM